MNRERSAWDVIKIALFLLILWASLGRVMNYNRAQQRMVDSEATIEAAIPLTAESLRLGTPWAPTE